MTYHYNYIWGTHGDDNIEGTDGNDIIFGGNGNDVIFGGNGSDIIFAGGGDDFIIGGFGLDFISGGSGNDTISWDNLSSGLSVDLKSQRVHFNVGGGERFYSIENIVGSRGNDIIKGNHLNNNLSGNKGNDRLEGRDGNDLLWGDEGNDRLYGGNGNDTIHGGSGNDKGFGGKGFDFFSGDTGNDFIDGGEGFDKVDYSELGQGITLKGAGSVDKGSAGQDTLFQIEEIIGAKGQLNTIDASTSDPNISVNINLEQETLMVQGLPAGDRTYTVRNFTVAKGTEQDDVFIGGDSNTDRVFFFGGGGNDLIRGGAGDDDLFGGLGNDTMIGGDGQDFMIGGGGNDFLTSLRSTDYLNGTDAEHAGAHEVDLLVGGLESDRFILGDIEQAYYVANGYEDYAGITDYGVGQDVIVLHGSASDYSLQISNGAAELSYTANHGSDRVAVINGNVGELKLNSSSFEFVA